MFHTFLAFPGYDNFHLVQATSPADIFDRIIMLVSPLNVVLHPKCIDAQVGKNVGEHA